MNDDPGIVADAARQLIEADNTTDALRAELRRTKALLSAKELGIKSYRSDYDRMRNARDRLRQEIETIKAERDMRVTTAETLHYRDQRDAAQREVERLERKLDEVQERWASGEASDGYHTHNELYEYRLLYNVALFNAWEQDNRLRGANSSPRVCKSWFHSDGQRCFDSDKWFIVVAELPTGQISNHYRYEHWSLFRIPVVKIPPEYDGHTPEIVAQRLRDYLQRASDDQ